LPIPKQFTSAALIGTSAPSTLFSYAFVQRRAGHQSNGLVSVFMRALRSTWRLRLLVGLLMVSLLPISVVMPESHGPTAASSQAEWLRSQVRVSLEGEPKAAFEHALNEATEVRARSLHGFLRAFADAYVTQAPEQPLAELFDAPDLSGERLIRYLQQRYAHISGVAALPRIFFSTYAASSPSSDRAMATGALVPATWHRALATAWTVLRSDAWTVVIPVRTLFSAQPMGP
jgi:hypothetical protein